MSSSANKQKRKTKTKTKLTTTTKWQKTLLKSKFGVKLSTGSKVRQVGQANKPTKEGFKTKFKLQSPLIFKQTYTCLLGGVLLIPGIAHYCKWYLNMGNYH